MSYRLSIPKDAAFVMASNVVGGQVIRRLESLGFSPQRIDPKKNAKIPGKARVLVVVPKAVSHGASDTAFKWKRGGPENNYLIMSNSANEVEKKLKRLGVVTESKDDGRLSKLMALDPLDCSSGIAYARALISLDPNMTLEDWRELVSAHGMDGVSGFTKGRFHLAVKEYRDAKGLPHRPRGGRPDRGGNGAGWVQPAAKKSAKKIIETGATINKAGEIKTHTKTQKLAPATSESETIASLVWEWMQKNDFSHVAFSASGDVKATKMKVVEPTFKMVVEEA